MKFSSVLRQITYLNLFELQRCDFVIFECENTTLSTALYTPSCVFNAESSSRWLGWLRRCFCRTRRRQVPDGRILQRENKEKLQTAKKRLPTPASTSIRPTLSMQFVKYGISVRTGSLPRSSSDCSLGSMWTTEFEL